MSVNAISNAGDWGAPSAESNWQNVLAASAKALGLSTGAVSQQLRAGASLSSLAEQQGVSQQTLTQAIAGALSPSTRSATTSTEQLEIATRIAQRVGGGQARHVAIPSGDPLLESLGESDSGDTLGALRASVATAYASNGTQSTPSPSGTAIDELA
jgi:hypothetical protein